MYMHAYTPQRAHKTTTTQLLTRAYYVNRFYSDHVLLQHVPLLPQTMTQLLTPAYYVNRFYSDHVFLQHVPLLPQSKAAAH